MRSLYHVLFALTLLAGVNLVFAEEKTEPIVTAPPPPEALLPQADGVEPKVSIISRDWGTIEEYSINGQVYAVKITPRVGPPYFFYDSDGDGNLELRTDINPEAPEINRWKILNW